MPCHLWDKSHIQWNKMTTYNKVFTLYSILYRFYWVVTSVDPDQPTHPCHVIWIKTGRFLVTNNLILEINQKKVWLSCLQSVEFLKKFVYRLDLESKKVKVIILDTLKVSRPYRSLKYRSVDRRDTCNLVPGGKMLPCAWWQNVVLCLVAECNPVPGGRMLSGWLKYKV